jgi:hypothetical protein
LKSATCAISIPHKSYLQPTAITLDISPFYQCWKRGFDYLWTFAGCHHAQHSRAWKPYHELHRKQRIFVCVSHQNLIIPNNHIAIATSTGLITQTDTETTGQKPHHEEEEEEDDDAKKESRTSTQRV